MAFFLGGLFARLESRGARVGGAARAPGSRTEEESAGGSPWRDARFSEREIPRGILFPEAMLPDTARCCSVLLAAEGCIVGWEGVPSTASGVAFHSEPQIADRPYEKFWLVTGGVRRPVCRLSEPWSESGVPASRVTITNARVCMPLRAPPQRPVFSGDVPSRA